MDSQFEKMKRVVLEAFKDGINLFASKVLSEAVNEAPLGPGGGDKTPGELRRSARLEEASLARLHATISFNTVYAAAQHEGIATMHHGAETWEWVVKKYTTPGTKKKFLEDPLKHNVPQLEPFLAKFIQKRLVEHGYEDAAAGAVAGAALVGLSAGSTGLGFGGKP